MRFVGKTVLVTGGASGIGQACCQGFAARVRDELGRLDVLAKYTDVLYEVGDSIATTTINRPDRLSCFRGCAIEEPIHAFLEKRQPDFARFR